MGCIISFMNSISNIHNYFIIHRATSLQHPLLYFLDKPVIRIEKVTAGNVKPNQPYSIELQCIVHGNPEPKVMWFKDHSMLDADGNINFQKNENSHNLIINTVTKSDYGKYKCRAENTAGESEKHVIIEGRPGMAKFDSKEHVNNEQQGTKVTWKLDSIFPVNKYTILYKNKKVIISICRNLSYHCNLVTQTFPTPLIITFISFYYKFSYQNTLKNCQQHLFSNKLCR